MTVIREATPADGAALAALERAAPETGTWRVRLEPRAGAYELAGRYPDVRGYVALGAGTSAGAADPAVLAGMLFGSLAPTQVNGAVVSGLYLFALRVHPTRRRRGVASALIAHAWERAREEAAVQVAWAAVGGGNVASLGAFRRAGFAPAGELSVRLVPPWPAPWRGLGRGAAWTAGDRAVRRATAADLPTLAGAFNLAHVDHNFWRPATPDALGRELTTAGHDLGDVLLATDATGVIAAGAALHLHRIAPPRLLAPASLPAPLRDALEPALARVPLRPLLLRHRLLLPEYPEAGAALLRALRRTGGRGAVLAAPLDRRDPAWAVAARLPDVAVRVHVVVRGAAVDPHRPLYVG